MLIIWVDTPSPVLQPLLKLWLSSVSWRLEASSMRGVPSKWSSNQLTRRGAPVGFGESVLSLCSLISEVERFLSTWGSCWLLFYKMLASCLLRGSLEAVWLDP